MALVDIVVVFPDDNTPTIPELSEKLQELVEEYSGGIMSVVLK